MMERRSQARVLIDMLGFIIRKGGVAKPTNLLSGANLSTKLMKDYLNYLLERGFVEKVEDNGRVSYRITDKGREAASEFYKMESIAKAFGIPI